MSTRDLNNITQGSEAYRNFLLYVGLKVEGQLRLTSLEGPIDFNREPMLTDQKLLDWLRNAGISYRRHGNNIQITDRRLMRPEIPFRELRISEEMRPTVGIVADIWPRARAAMTQRGVVAAIQTAHKWCSKIRTRLNIRSLKT